MRVLVLHSHPLEDSLSAALRDRAVRALSDGSHEVQVVRLGRGDEPGPSGHELSGTDALVLVYPTWWGGPPAPLLDWIQRTAGPWIDGPDRSPATSPLRSVRQLVVITTHGSSRLVNVAQGEPGRQFARHSLLRLCASGARLRWIALYKVDRLEPAAIGAFVDRVGSELGRLSRADRRPTRVTTAGTSA